MNLNMLYGYVSAMREVQGLKPYSNVVSMESAIRDHRLPCRLVRYGESKTYRRWWKADETAAALCAIRNRGKAAFHSNPATEEELASGDWQDVIVAARLTGIRKQRITDIGNHHPELTRMHPVTQDRLVHVPSIRELGYWREEYYLRKHLGDAAANALLETRPRKRKGPKGREKTYVYCPELAHL